MRVKDFEDINTEDFSYPLLSELENCIFTVVNGRIDLSDNGEYAVVVIVEDDTEDIKEQYYRTSSKVLIKQIKRIIKLIDAEDTGVRVKLIEVKGEKYNYFKFVAPE